MLLRYMHLDPAKCQHLSVFYENMVVKYEFETKCFVFQNSKSTVTFDQYFT